MITAPDTGVVLGQEDAQKIELVNRRLSTLQREVLAATQELSTLDNEIISTQKAKKYEEEQLITVTAQVEALRREQQDLTLSITEGSKELEKHRNEHGQMHSVHSSKLEQLEQKEKDVLEAERDLAKNELSLSIKERQLEADRAEVENARNMFLDAISSVTWR